MEYIWSGGVLLQPVHLLCISHFPHRLYCRNGTALQVQVLTALDVFIFKLIKSNYICNIYFYTFMVTLQGDVASNLTITFRHFNLSTALGECEAIRDYRENKLNEDTDQPLFAMIAKYVIMGLAGINIIREVHIVLISSLFNHIRSNCNQVNLVLQDESNLLKMKYFFQSNIVLLHFKCYMTEMNIH